MRTKVGTIRTGILYALLGAGLGGCYWPYYEPPAVYGPAYPGYPYNYYYYPSAGVYYELHSGEYWYPHRGEWQRDRALPPEYHLRRDDRVDLRARDSRPWEHHDEHANQYQPHPGFRPDPRGDQREREHNREMYERYQRDQGDRGSNQDPNLRGQRSDVPPNSRQPQSGTNSRWGQ